MIKYDKQRMREEIFMRKSLKPIMIVICLLLLICFSACAESSCGHVDKDGNKVCDDCGEKLQSNETKPTPTEIFTLIEDGEPTFQIVIASGTSGAVPH